MRLAAQRVDGPEGATPLVIAHGLFGSARNWATLAKRFAEERPVLAVDLRNHGDSGWDDAMEYVAMGDDLLETLDVAFGAGSRAVLLGHSMGGKTMMAAALAAPERAAAVISADMAPVVYDHSHAPFIDAMRGMDLSAVSRRSQADPMLAAAIPEPPLRAFILQNLMIEDGRARWRLNLDAIAAAMSDLTGWPSSLEPRALSARRYDGPALFYHGGASEYVTEAAQGRIRLLFPAAEIEAMPGAGHWLHAERPDAFFETVSAWLRRSEL
ncbi:MAG: alpha/beta fold hydrolase [Rhodobacteraceae bacterium]|nr:alpha/beta fold hydrolase [Paracoccaceae bacterium]